MLALTLSVMHYFYYHFQEVFRIMCSEKHVNETHCVVRRVSVSQLVQTQFKQTGRLFVVFLCTQFGNDPSCLQSATSECTSDQVEFIEETWISKSHVTTLNQEYHHWQYSVGSISLSFSYVSYSNRGLEIFLRQIFEGRKI